MGFLTLYLVFAQIVFVSAVIPVAMEILRVVPIVLAFVRGYVGPRLNQKEREKKFIFLRPLADPSEFSHFSTLAQVVSYNPNTFHAISARQPLISAHAIEAGS